MKLADLPPVLRVQQVAEVLGISTWATYEAIKRGQIPALRLGRSLRVSRAALAQLLGEEE